MKAYTIKKHKKHKKHKNIVFPAKNFFTLASQPK